MKLGTKEVISGISIDKCWWILDIFFGQLCDSGVFAAVVGLYLPYSDAIFMHSKRLEFGMHNHSLSEHQFSSLRLFFFFLLVLRQISFWNLYTFFLSFGAVLFCRCYFACTGLLILFLELFFCWICVTTSIVDSNLVLTARVLNNLTIFSI